MQELKKNELYQKIHKSFAAAGFEESIACLQGFVLGLISRGHSSSDPKSLELTVNILNGGTRFSGTGIATFTTMAIELERELENEKLSLFIPGKDESSPKKLLQAIADLAYGFNLGLCCESRPVAGSIVQEDYPLRNTMLNENVEMLNEIANVDTECELDDESVEVVAEQLERSMIIIYGLMHGKALPAEATDDDNCPVSLSVK